MGNAHHRISIINPSRILKQSGFFDLRFIMGKNILNPDVTSSGRKLVSSGCSLIHCCFFFCLFLYAISSLPFSS